MIINLLNLFFPQVCLSCDNPLEVNELYVCTVCRHELPLTNFESTTNNALTKKLYGRVLLRNASSLLWFSKKGLVQHLLHNLKYKGHEEIGEFLGKWLGEELSKRNEFKTVDVVIPVPLHSKRLKQRGFNQVHKFGKQLADALECDFNTEVLQKTKATTTQVFKDRIMRWINDDALFMVTEFETLKGKHILLVDDIITTGATIETCANALSKIEGVTISVATMAIAE
ncbi:ComF family protein [Gelidibacter pelagius]|uniref:ComF family protein n=1 Tax=Gelidibacter pelagius TaxID=2819985 RepID=A0ABS3STM7_9FLAO|nr:phosphoribosyltransferase family protein [Gelidibacter pelagius]MBO3099073.1 ComF family protein [Gelidibacter pelagius]